MRSRSLYPEHRPMLAVENEEDRTADMYGNETRELRGAQAAFERPWRKDDRWWLRWPAKAWWFMGHRYIPHGGTSEYRPASHWSVRWLGSIWRAFRRSGGFNSTMGPLLQSRLNFLLIFLPLAFIAFKSYMAPDVVLAFCFLAIIPLSGVVQLSCEHLSASMNPTLQGLLVAFSDNLVELVVSEPRIAAIT